MKKSHINAYYKLHNAEQVKRDRADNFCMQIRQSLFTHISF